MQIVRLQIFFDINMNVIVTPIKTNQFGAGIISLEYIKLIQGWSNFELTHAIMSALETSLKNEPEDNQKLNFWTEATGIKSFSEFSKKHQCVSIVYRSDRNTYDITKEKRFKDGSYGLNIDDVKYRIRTYQGHPLADTIADLVLETLKIE